MIVYLRFHERDNFGDALNPLIWDRFLPGFFDDDRSTVFVGIGSLLGFDFDADARKIVFTTGFGGGDPDNYGHAPTLDETWEIVCVRGPLTAEALCVSEGLAVTDGAALVHRMEWPDPPARSGVAFMPHVRSLEFLDAEALCADAGLRFVDPRNEPASVVAAILQCERIVTEALHGAIVADALRVPWVPVRMFRQVNEFKWRDWTASMELDEVTLNRLPELFDRTALRRIAARKLGPLGIGPFAGVVAGAYGLWQDAAVRSRVLSTLHHLTRSDGHLSRESVLAARCDRLEELLAGVEKRWGR